MPTTPDPTRTPATERSAPRSAFVLPQGVAVVATRALEALLVLFILGALFSNIDVFSLAATGDYTLVIEGSAYQTVPIGYGFTLYRVTDDKTSLTLDSTVNGTLAIPGQTDQFTFHLAQDTRVYFDALTANSSLTWTLAGAAGTVANRNFYYSDSDTLGGTNPFMLLRAGDYTLTVDGSGATTGDQPSAAYRSHTLRSTERGAKGTSLPSRYSSMSWGMNVCT